MQTMKYEAGAEATGPLAGIRVLDVSGVVSGPLCAQILGDLGASVVKLETPAGDVSRRLGPPFVEGGFTPLFTHCNRNKRAIVVDLKQDEGQAIARKLAAEADVFIQNFRPGVADRLGIGYEALSKTNPGIVYVSIDGFGDEGPYAGQPAYDMVIQALSGMAGFQGSKEAPQLIKSLMADKSSALTAAYNTIAALFARDRGDGRGQKVDIPMIDAYAAFALPDVITPLTFLSVETPVIPELGDAIYKSWQTKDGHVAMIVIEDRQFHAMCRVMDREDLIEDERFASLPARIMNAASIFPLIEEELRKFPTAELVERALRHEAPLAPIHDPASFLEDPQVKSNQTVFEVEHPTIGPMLQLRAPARFSRTPSNVRSLPPSLGENTDELLAEAGYDTADVERLRGEGVVA